jgi:tetratricopeptide (TPR) repeat protein
MKAKNLRYTSLLGAMLSLLPCSALGQLQLPRPSPAGKVSQTVGLTEITVEYSSPAVKGRKIWGSLVPYGEVWRAGANQATKVTFTKDVTIGSSPVPTGSYALFVIPEANEWTLILNKDFNQAGAFNYKKELDVARVQVQPKPIAHRERLAYLISDFTDDSASLDLEWEKLRASLPIKLGTQAQALANIKAMTDGAWSPYTNAARYMLESAKDYDAGLQLVDKSIATKEHWYNLWTKAELLAAKGKYKEALTYAQKAKQLGDKTPQTFFMADDVNKALKEWKNSKS